MKEEILQESSNLLLRYGIKSVSMADIAREIVVLLISHTNEIK